MYSLEHIPFLLPDSDEAQRIFHGRGHAYQGYEYISIDWLPPVILITLYKQVERKQLLELAKKLQARVPQCRSIQVQYRHQAGAPFELLTGEVYENTIVKENDLKYHIRLSHSQNTGLFLDMKNGRQWVRERSQNANVLNLFAYTCAFSVAAISGGARQVVNMDLSRVSLTVGRQNHRLNGLDISKVKFEAVNIFKSFGRIKKYGPYDLLICDPPSFQKGSIDIARDYKKIIRRIPEFMKPDSLLMLCLNSPDLDTQFLLQTVADYCPACEFIDEIKTPKAFIETEYGKGLKVLIFQYRD